MENERLTPRENEVLHWIAEGKTADEIAVILGCGYHSVNSHRAAMMEKMGVFNSAALVAKAFRRGIMK